MMLKNIVAFLTVIIFSSVVYGHCQIPCGIFDDETRIELMKEHVVTIEKSINELNQSELNNLWLEAKNYDSLEDESS